MSHSDATQQPPLDEPHFVGAAHLRALAEVAANYVVTEGSLAAVGSAAAADLQDDSYGGAWGPGTQMVTLEVVPRVVAVVDHVRGLAALAVAPGVAVALASLVRPTLDGLANLSWLYEPGIDTRERVRRRFNLRLVSLAQEENVAGLVGSAPGTFKPTIDAIAVEAHRHGFRFSAPTVSQRGIIHPGHLDAPVPSDETLINRLSPSAGTGFQVGTYMYRRTSAVVHGQIHGLHPFLTGHESLPETGIVRAELALTLSWFAAMSGSVVAALNTTVRQLGHHYGWEIGPWDVVHEPAVEQWIEWFSASVDVDVD